MKRASGYIGVLAVLALAACGDAEPEARETPMRAAPAAAQEEARPVTEAGVEASPNSAAPAAASTEVAEPIPAPGAGNDQRASVEETATPAGRSAPMTAAVRERAPAPASPRPTETPSDVAAVLRRAERAYDEIRSLEADFTQAVTVPLLETTQHSRGKLYIRRPDRFLMRFSDPEGDIVVADGSYFWMYYPSADPKQVIRTSIGSGSRQVDFQKEFLSDPLERYDAVLEGVEEVNGRPAHVVRLTPRGPSGYQRVRIWVDREDALVRRFEIVEENESVRRLDLRGLRPNVALDDQLFRFTPPPGAQVFTQ